MNCKICGKYSGKRKVCKNCKEKYPSSPSGKGGVPFNRKELFEKDKIKNERINNKP